MTAGNGDNGAPLVWAFTGIHDGDNAQILALAEELGYGFVEKSLRFNPLHHFARIKGLRSLVSLDAPSRRSIAGPWPDLIILAGRRAVPIAMWVRERTGGKTKLVIIGHPRIHPANFDLVLTTRQYPVPPSDNVRLLPVAMSRFREPPLMTPEERIWLDKLPRPHLLMALGGPTAHFALPAKELKAQVTTLCARAKKLGGTLIVVRSRRTTPAMLAAAQAAIGECGAGVCTDGRMPRFKVLMDQADELFPTAESVSMISESIITGKPVGIVPAVQTLYGKLTLTSNPGPNTRFRNLMLFWDHLAKLGIHGTIEQPVASDTPNPVIEAAALVRKLLHPSPDARQQRGIDATRVAS